MAVVTISRRFGAGGRTIGEKLAEKLSYAYVHEDMIREIAKKIQVPEDRIKEIETRGTSKFQKFLEKKILSSSYISRLVSEDYKYVDESTYVDAVKTVMFELYERDNCVVVGRAGQFILRDKPNAYHVLLMAPLEYRIKFLVDHYYLKESEAEKAINRADNIRTRFLSFFADPSEHDNCLNYHLVVNTQRVDENKTIKLIIDLIG